MCDKLVIQSHLLTAARYDFSIQEKRIVYRIMESAQAQLKGLKLEGVCRVEEKWSTTLQMPLAKIFPEGVKVHLDEAKKAFDDLMKKVIHIQTGDTWQAYHYIDWVKIEEDTNVCAFRITADIWKAFMDFTRGFDTYRLGIAMSYVSTYSMRWYELLANNENPITYSIDWIKTTFKIEGKYDKYNMFKQRVIDTPIKEINDKSDVVITYTEVFANAGKRGRKAVKAITFTTKPKATTDQIAEIQKILRMNSYKAYGLINKNVIDYLQNHFGYTDKEIISQARLLYRAEQALTWEGLIDKLQLVREECREHGARNNKGYVVNSLKNELGITTDSSPKRAKKGQPKNN